MTEIIIDPAFSTLGTAASPWTLLTHEGILMTPRLQDSILALEISKAKGANWHGELRYSPFPVRLGDVFQLGFSAKARQPFLFSVWLGQQDSPWKSLVSRKNYFGEKEMTSHWQTFTHTWEAVLNEPKARLNFVVGPIDNLIEIKDVSLIKS